MANGDTQKVTPSYHTLEFETPIKLTGDSFVVVFKTTNGTNQQFVSMESKQENSLYSDVIVNTNESYVTTGSDFSSNKWQDLATMSNADFRGNVCIKAFTTSKLSADNENNNNSNNNDNNPNNNNNNNNDNNNNQTSIKPTPSNFTDASSEVSDISYHFYTDLNKKPHAKMKIKIFNIKIGNNDDSYTYKYYFSGKKGEKDIADSKWIDAKIQKEKDGTYSIIIDVDSTDLEKNIDLAKSDTLYIYIKEIAKSDNNTIESIHT